MSHWQPCGRALVPLLGDAISVPHGEQQRRQQQLLPPAMSALPIVHKNAKIAHHTHRATARLLADKEAAEADAEREYRGEHIFPPRTLLLGNNSPQGGGGG